MLDFSHPKGICFQCQRCTLCCGDTPTHVRHVLLLESEAGQISQALSKRIGEFATTVEGREPYFHEMKKTAEECKCIFLNESHCTIYAIRPLVCRFYPFELKTGANGELEFSCTRECKGIGKGRELSGTFFESLFREAQERLVEASAKRNENNPPNRERFENLKGRLDCVAMQLRGWGNEGQSHCLDGFGTRLAVLQGNSHTPQGF